jgi:predicted aminopeptidase
VTGKKKRSWLKMTLWILLGAFVLFCVWQQELLYYSLSQGKGQLNIVLNTRPLKEVYEDPQFPDSLKDKIRLIQEIRKYAFDSLGLNHNDNYTTVYDQGNKPVLWVLTACEAFKLKAKEWTFPLLGSFSYKGFFKIDKAQVEEKKLISEGFDTSIDEVGGWSTLGWFKDPILTNMLKRSDGQLANLIIHELTHGTLYVKNNVDFNENLASFVGDKGALKFLAYKYGTTSAEYLSYKKSRLASRAYTRLVLDYSRKFDSLYLSFVPGTGLQTKKKAKKKMFREFEDQLQLFADSYGTKGNKRYKIEHLNNTYLMDVKRYREDAAIFEKEFSLRFKSDFNKYITYLKSKYPSL